MVLSDKAENSKGTSRNQEIAENNTHNTMVPGVDCGAHSYRLPAFRPQTRMVPPTAGIDLDVTPQPAAPPATPSHDSVVINNSTSQGTQTNKTHINNTTRPTTTADTTTSGITSDSTPTNSIPHNPPTSTTPSHHQHHTHPERTHTLLTPYHTATIATNSLSTSISISITDTTTSPPTASIQLAIPKETINKMTLTTLIEAALSIEPKLHLQQIQQLFQGLCSAAPRRSNIRERRGAVSERGTGSLAMAIPGGTGANGVAAGAMMCGEGTQGELLVSSLDGVSFTSVFDSSSSADTV
ncbi:hypothetical protein J1614_007654 [Plenodomus biglobosus]|nr:hypothetical protein J1614_007654 [Plenodomus biglobosus]